MRNMKVLITICARGGSKGIPGKNIKPLNGKPLLHYTLAHATSFAQQHDTDILLSTDSDEILACAASAGYHTEYRRPEELAGDKVGKIETIRHAWEWAENDFGKEYDFVLDMDVTSPLRTQEDLEKALTQIQLSEEALDLFSVSPASRNPYFNMVELTDEGFAKVAKSGSEIKSRQTAPLVYDMNASFYFFRRAFMAGPYQSSITPKSLAYVMKHTCFDLDEPLDFQVLELMLERDLLDFRI